MPETTPTPQRAESAVGAVDGERPISPVRQLIAGAAGHTIQWYDFIAYTYLAVFFADRIFPATSDDDLVPLIATYGVFAVGFIMRPIGGLILGPLADRFGRRAILQLTVMLMATGSLLIAVLPTYDQVGLLAPVILIFARLIQSFAEGGEFATGSVFLAESATEGKRGFYSSFMFVGSGLAKMITLGLVAVLTGVLNTGAMEEFGWRIPFAIGALAAVWGWWLRRGAAETIDVEPSKERRSIRQQASDAFEGLRSYPGKSLQVFALSAGISLQAYFWSVYFPIYAGINGDLGAQDTQFIGLIGLTFYTALIPLVGLLSDRVGRRPILYVFGIGTAVLTMPLLSGIGSDFTLVLLAQFAGLAVLACGTSVLGAVIAEMFPAHLRVTGMALPYNLAVTIFGGTVSVIGTALVSSGQSLWFGVYLTAASVITLIATITLRGSDTAVSMDAEPDVRARVQEVSTTTAAPPN